MIFSNSNSGSMYVVLDKKEIEYCRGLAKKRCKYKIWGDNSSEANKTYNKGNLNSEEDNSKTERIGLYVEKAFSALSGLPMDETISDEGDPGWDFLLPFKEKQKPVGNVRWQLLADDSEGVKIDIKTLAFEYPKKDENYGELYITASKNGKEHKLNADYYCFCAIIHHDGVTRDKRGYKTEKDANFIIIEIYGFIATNDILKNAEKRIGNALTKNKNANWKNYYIKKEELISTVEFMSSHKNCLNYLDMDLFF